MARNSLIHMCGVVLICQSRVFIKICAQVAAVDKPQVHLWETGIMRITRHPQMVCVTVCGHVGLITIKLTNSQ